MKWHLFIPRWTSSLQPMPLHPHQGGPASLNPSLPPPLTPGHKRWTHHSHLLSALLPSTDFRHLAALALSAVRRMLPRAGLLLALPSALLQARPCLGVPCASLLCRSRMLRPVLFRPLHPRSGSLSQHQTAVLAMTQLKMMAAQQQAAAQGQKVLAQIQQLAHILQTSKLSPWLELQPRPRGHLSSS